MEDDCGDHDGVAGPSAEKRRQTAKDFPNFVTTDVNEVLQMLDDDDLYGSDSGSDFDDRESSDSEVTDSIVRACGDVVLPSVLRRQAEREERAEMNAQYSDRLLQSDDDSEYDPNDDSNPDYDSDGSTTSAASQVLFATLPGLPTQTSPSDSFKFCDLVISPQTVLMFSLLFRTPTGLFAQRAQGKVRCPGQEGRIKLPTHGAILAVSARNLLIAIINTRFVFLTTIEQYLAIAI
jgi:hypothetical protein